VILSWPSSVATSGSAGCQRSGISEGLTDGNGNPHQLVPACSTEVSSSTLTLSKSSSR
jgi:hypothetical protein